MQKGISESIEGWRLMLDAARTNPAIAQDIATLGYTAKRLTEGTTLVMAAKGQHQEYQQALGDRCGATDALKLAHRTANTLYIFHLKVARLTIPKDRDLWRTLMLNGSREKAFSGWLEQVEAFYVNLPEALPYLDPYGITAAVIEQAKAQVQAVMDARVSQTHCKGAAQLSKQQRDQTLVNLKEWMTDFTRAARYLYAKNPRQLESLGL